MTLYVDPNGNAMQKPLSTSTDVSLRQPQPGTMAQSAAPSPAGASPGVSPVEEAKAMRAPPKVPGNVSDAMSPRQAAMYRRGQALADTGKKLAGGLRTSGLAAVASEGFNDYKMAGDIDTSAGGTIGYLQNGEYGNAASSLGRGAVETGLDLASGVAGLGDIALPGQPLKNGLRNLVTDAFPTAFKTAGGQAVSTAGAGRGSVNPAAADPNGPRPTPLTQPNTPPNAGPSLSNDLPAGWQARALDTASDNSVRRVTTPDGRTLYTNVAGPDNAALMGMRGGAVSIAPGAPGVPTASSVAPTPATEPMVAGGGAASLGGSVPSQVRSAQTFRDQVAQGNAQRAVTDGLRSGNARERAAAMQLAGQLSGDIENTARASARNEVEQGMNETNNATAQRGQDTQRAIAEGNNAVSLRGQDVQAGIARMQGRMAQMKDDRQYQLDVAKFGEERAKTMFGQRQEADKNLTTKLESMFVGEDGKPDSTAVAEVKRGVVGALAGYVEQLSKIPANSPDYAEAQKTAEAIQQRGAAALSDDKLQKLIAQIELARRARANHSAINPFASDFREASDPNAYNIVGVDKGIFQDQYVTANGTRIPTRLADFAGGGTGVPIPSKLVDVPTTQFDILKGMRQ